ncbi:MAG: aminoglycoside phosphotransferase, partial [Actinomycetota bacterium]|nr:aminoglycoside phosphotransferase [Actinomycetota bacterium]
MDTTVLASYLARQRWYAGKSRAGEITRVQTAGHLRSEVPRVRVDLVTVDYPGGDVETYQLPLVAYPQPADHLAHAFVSEERDDGGTRWWLYDALHDKQVTSLWLRGIAAATPDAESPDGRISFHRAPGEPDVPVDAPSIVVGAEQSNTSLIFDDRAILKVFRKVSPGCNPDIEIHDALARIGSPHIAPPLGWVEGRWTDPATGEAVKGSLAMSQVFLRNATEGWEFAKTSVRDLYAEGDLHADEVGGDFAGESFRLGLVTAEVHAALADALPGG